MPRLYVDLDNNRLVTGAQSTELAPTPTLYQGDKPNLDVELLTLSNGVLSHYTSTASAVNARIGTLGGSAVASALTLSVVTLSVTATATAGIISPVTATGTSTLLGSIQATATVGVNTPATGSITANFSQVQLPSLVPVLKGNSLVALEITTCGNYFTAVPCVFVSEPDIFRVNKAEFNAQSANNATVITSADTYNWPTVISLYGDARFAVTNPNDAGSGYWPYSASVVIDSDIGPVATVGINGSLNGNTSVTGSAVFSVVTPLALSGNLRAILTAQQTGGLTSVISAKVYYQYRSSENSALITTGLDNGKPSFSISTSGNGYSDSPDIFVIPQPQDYVLGSGVTLSSASISGRTCVVTAFSHGITSGSLVMVEALDCLHPLGGKYFGVKGVWPVVSVTSNSLVFRIDKFASHPNASISLVTAGAKIYPVNLTRSLAAVSVSCAGSSYPAAAQIPFSISSDSCDGIPALAVVTVGNNGSLQSISITCAGSGFTSSSTVVSLPNYCKLSGLTVTCAGAGYWENLPDITVNSATYVTTAPGATQAVLTASLNGTGGVILTIVSAGYGYSSAPIITIANPNNGNGVRRVTITTSGVGYSDGTFACSVATAPAGGATAVVNFVKSGTSQGFVVADPGRGYITAPIVTVPAPDLGGQVNGFSITSAGAGYAQAPSVTLTGGNGSGAAALAIINNGSITSISLISQGSGYTSAPSVIMDAPPSAIYYSRQINLSTSSVATLLLNDSTGSAYLQIDENRGSDTTVLAQIPVTIQARVS
jgi:hypothetical protein